MWSLNNVFSDDEAVGHQIEAVSRHRATSSEQIANRQQATSNEPIANYQRLIANNQWLIADR